MFFDNTAVLYRHLPTAELHQARPQIAMTLVEWGVLQRLCCYDIMFIHRALQPLPHVWAVSPRRLVWLHNIVARGPSLPGVSGSARPLAYSHPLMSAFVASIALV